MMSASHTEKAENAVEEPTDAQIESWVQEAIDLFPGVAMRNKERERALARSAFELGWSNGLRDGLAQGHAKRPVRQHVAKTLSGLMRARGMDVQSLAQSSGIAPQTIEDYLCARREIQFDLLRPMATALGVRLMDVFRPKRRARSPGVLKDVVESIANFPNG